ncbi:putative Locus-specific chromosome binding protein [Planoprotostelium fungivorum]|uniref:Putative Locus-specific chromosome binding protein n=1 Tax=Planoprotostelium fungivorum TaxID=1890364 RepID=A0A2P6MZX1_9EUKA|nr:putative Locus-specific chromosome binding protein [Planoprotostelium fungivorum]
MADRPEDEDTNHSNKDEEEEEEENSNYREPIVDGRDIKFETRILNEFLVCSLCMGYIKDAHTIVECLHTFCKSCITKYLRDKTDCPTCEVALGPYPLDKIKFDRQIHNIVCKIFPQFEAEDAEEERKYYSSVGLKTDPPPAPAPAPANNNGKPDANKQPYKKVKKEDKSVFYTDEVGFELNVDEKNTNPELRPLDKPFIRTSAKVTVKHLKKYILNKLHIDLEKAPQVEIRYRGEVLGSEHTLAYIFKSRGTDPSTKNPNFKYSMPS